MIVFFIGIVVILLSTWILICYVSIKYIAGFLGKLTAAKWLTGKIVVIVLTIFMALLPFFFMLNSSSAKNYKTAYIQPQGREFKITVKGKRAHMVHDPVSALWGNTHEDSISFLIPRQNGIMNKNDIVVLKDDYNLNGTIAIDRKKMTIQLYYDKDQKSPLSWNDSYNLTVR